MSQKIPECLRRFQIVSEGSRMSQKIPECPRRFWNAPEDSEVF